MKKLKLQLEDLRVDGFSTTPPEQGKGTVAAHSHWTCIDTCGTMPTCAETCPNTCPFTCDDYSCAYESCGGTCFQSRCVDSCLCN